MIFLPKIISAQDTLVCDNGGFESNFQYYKGQAATYFTGSDDCEPKNGSGFNVTWSSPLSLPATRRFEIVTSGTDPLVGFNTTKFGSQALKMNNKYGHTGDQCQGHRDVNRLTKRFKVTEATRDFTVWYSVILENPTSHVNSQPFFSISCDLAPGSDLCFDAAIVECEDEYEDPNCDFDPIDAIDWSCHRIKIPASEIGNIATLEILTADCGCSAHFGYAYIDGICEECTGSALGSIQLYDDVIDTFGLGIIYKSCDGETATVCGSYTLPTICGFWHPDSIKVPGFTIQNVVFDYENKTFCFEFPLSNFGAEDCLEIFAEIYFGSGTFSLFPQNSNSIELCKDLYEDPYDIFVDVLGCNPNGIDDGFLSDDYYYVTVDLGNVGSSNWTITKVLYNPYSGESDIYPLGSGVGDDNLVLGPFLIQDGEWKIIIELPGCTYAQTITPPPFCSSDCGFFDSIEITNVRCRLISGVSNWSFDLLVPGNSSNQYTLTGPGGSFFNYNNTVSNNIFVGPITQNCVTYTLIDDETDCEVEILICPPMPCETTCKLDVKINEVKCDEENEGDFYVKLDVVNSSGLYLCYRANGGSSTAFPGSGILGPFTTDVTIVVYLCSNSNCNCANPTCFKVIHIEEPDCDEREESEPRSYANIEISSNLLIIPNPFNTDEVTLKSSMSFTNFEIYSSDGKLLKRDSFKGEEYKFSFKEPSGLYYFKYLDNEGKINIVKAIKL